MKLISSAIAMVCIFLSRSTPAAPEFSPGPGYAAVPFFTGAGDPANYNAGLQGLDFSADGTAYFFAGNRYILKQAPGMPAEELYDYGATVWGSFVRVWGETVYFGESTNGTVKSVPAAGGPAAELFTLEGNYDGRFNSQSRLFLSANPGWIGNRIYAWWEGQPAAAVTAEVGDYSGPLVFDAEDNLYYGRSTSYPPGPEEIVYYTAAQVAAALDTGIPLTFADWTVYAAGVDAPGHLVFDGGGAFANLFSAASGPGTVSRVAPAGPRLLGRGTYPEKLAFFGDGRLEPFSPSAGGLGVVATDYNDTYNGTAYLVRSCPQNFILGAGDYAAPGQSGIAVFRPASGLWAVRGLTRVYFGRGGDLPVPGDYTGAGTAGLAVFRPSTGLWAVAGGGRIYFGRADDIPVPRDYGGAGPSARAVFRPSSGLWLVRGMTRVYFGAEGDFPLSGDYDGSGTVAPAVFRPSAGLWVVRGGGRSYFGEPGDLPVPGDYDGSGTENPAVFRPESGLWAVRGLTRFYFGSGAAGDVPVPLDLDGDGVLDPAVFRPESGLWAVRGLTRVHFGSAEDFPAAR